MIRISMTSPAMRDGESSPLGAVAVVAVVAVAVEGPTENVESSFTIAVSYELVSEFGPKFVNPSVSVQCTQ